MVFDCLDPSNDLKSSSLYITAQIKAKRIRNEMNFTVGDGFYYGGFLNVPLKNGRDYYIFLRAVSQWNMVGSTIIMENVFLLHILYIILTFIYPGFKKLLCSLG